MNETFSRALRDGGLKAFLFSLLFSVLLFMAVVIIALVSIAPELKGLIYENAGPGNLILYTVIIIVLAFVAGSLTYAGLWGSYKDAIEGYQVTMGSYWASAKEYFLRFMGYSFLYGILAFVLSLPFGLFIFANVNSLSTMSPWSFGRSPSYLLLQIVSMIFFSLVLVPRLVLTVVRYDRHNFVRENFKPLLLYSFAGAVMLVIPVIGALISSLIEAFYPLFVMSLYQEKNKPAEDVTL